MAKRTASLGRRKVTETREQFPYEQLRIGPITACHVQVTEAPSGQPVAVTAVIRELPFDQIKDLIGTKPLFRAPPRS